MFKYVAILGQAGRSLSLVATACYERDARSGLPARPLGCRICWRDHLKATT